MNVDLLEFARKLAQGARAKVIEDRQRLEKIQAAGGQRQSDTPAPGR